MLAPFLETVLQHGGHDGPGDVQLGAEVVELVALHDAVDVEQVHRGLGVGGDGGGVVKGQGIGGEPVGHGPQLHGPDQVDGQVLLLDGVGEVAGLVEALQIRAGQDAGGQADGELLVEPGLFVVEEGLDLRVVVGGDVHGGAGVQADGAGAQGQGLSGGELVLRLEVAVFIALEHPGGRHGLDVALGPVGLDIGEGGGGGRRQCGQGEHHDQREQAGEQSFHFHAGHLHGVWWSAGAVDIRSLYQVYRPRWKKATGSVSLPGKSAAAQPAPVTPSA